MLTFSTVGLIAYTLGAMLAGVVVAVIIGVFAIKSMGKSLAKNGVATFIV